MHTDGARRSWIESSRVRVMGEWVLGYPPILSTYPTYITNYQPHLSAPASKSTPAPPVSPCAHTPGPAREPAKARFDSAKHVCMYCMYVCMYVCVYVSMYVCIVSMYVCRYVCVYVCRQVGMYVGMYACMYVCRYVCM